MSPVSPHSHSIVPELGLFSEAPRLRNLDTFNGGRWRGGALQQWSLVSRTSLLKVVTSPHPQEQARSGDGRGTTKIAAFTLIPTWEELVVPGQIRMTLQDENDQ